MRAVMCNGGGSVLLKGRSAGAMAARIWWGARQKPLQAPCTTAFMTRMHRRPPCPFSRVLCLPRHAALSTGRLHVSSSALLRADAGNEDMALQWSDSFDNKLKMLVMEAKALERELCENPAPDRQAVIGKTLARSARARALGEELLSLYDELSGLMEVIEDDKEDASTREAFRAESVVTQERIHYLQSELIVELLPRDLDDELGVVLEVRAAAGGSEASLFASEIFEMYQKYCHRRGWKFEAMSVSPSGM